MEEETNRIIEFTMLGIQGGEIAAAVQFAMLAKVPCPLPEVYTILLRQYGVYLRAILLLRYFFPGEFLFAWLSSGLYQLFRAGLHGFGFSV